MAGEMDRMCIDKERKTRPGQHVRQTHFQASRLAKRKPVVSTPPNPLYCGRLAAIPPHSPSLGGGYGAVRAA